MSTHPKNHFLQTYEWGVFKSKSPEWSFETVGLENDQGELVAAALVLIRFLPIIKRPFYIFHVDLCLTLIMNNN